MSACPIGACPLGSTFFAALCLLFARIEDRHKCFLRYLNVANALHASFTFFLFFEQLHLARYISAIELLRYVLAKAGQAGAGYASRETRCMA